MMDYKVSLLNIFEQVRTIQQIDDAIATVLENDSIGSEDEKLEEMINLLVVSGDSALTNTDAETLPQGENEAEEGAVGFAHQNRNQNETNQFRITARTYQDLKDLFPNVSLEFFENFCQNVNVESFEDLIELLASTDYVRNEVGYLQIWEQLKAMLPNADPIYLRNQARVLVERPPLELENFIQNALDNSDYPTYQDYLKRKEKQDALSIYKAPFQVDKYLEQHPDPVGQFTSTIHKPALSDNSNQEDIEMATIFLYNQYNYLRKDDINRVFKGFHYNLLKTSNRLKIFPKAFTKKPRPAIEEKDTENEALLQELAFIKYEKIIKQTIKQKNDYYNLILTEARKYGLLETCSICAFDELIPEECYFCKNNCVFCKDCVKNWAHEIIGRGEMKIPCASCDSEFSYTTLQMTLDKNIFQRLCQRRQIEEIKQANIEGMETCPYCDFSMIPVEGDKIFKCGNLECMKETCRGCGHPPHLPLKCSEIEYDEDVKMRTFIENKMTEALLRQCWKCSKKFYKESGCNKMTCTCGARMCYLCGSRVKDYTHFGSERCPLYTEDLNKLHLDRVRAGAQLAKTELGVIENPQKLKFDPARDLENGFNQ